MPKGTYIFKLFLTKVPDDGSSEPKHVALCDMTLQRCVGRHIFVYDNTHQFLT